MNDLLVLTLVEPSPTTDRCLQLVAQQRYSVERVQTNAQLLTKLRSQENRLSLLLLDLSAVATSAIPELLSQVRVAPGSDLLPIVVLDTYSADRERIRATFEHAVFHYISLYDEVAALTALAAALAFLRSPSNTLVTAPYQRIMRAVVQRVAEAIQQKPDNFEPIQREILTALHQLTGADDFALALYDPITNEYQRHAANRRFSLTWKYHLIGTSLTRVVVESGGIEYFPDVRVDPVVNPDISADGVRSLLVVRIKQTGALYAYSARPSYFNSVHIWAVEMLAELSLNLLESYQQAALERTLREVANLLATQPARAVPTAILRQMAAIVPYTTATIQSKEGDQLRIIEAVGYSEEHRLRLIGRRISLQDERSPNKEVIDSRQPYYLSDAANDPRYTGFQRTQQGDIRSWLGIPLIVNDAVIGMLTIDQAAPEFYRPLHIERATAFGSIAASALRSMQLNEQLGRGLALLEQINKGLIELQPDEAVLKAIARGIRNTLPCQTVALYPYDAWAGRFEAEPIASGFAGETPPTYSGLEEKVIRVFAEGQVFQEAQPATQPPGDVAALPTGEVWAGLRMDVRDRFIGMLFINYPATHSFSAEEKDLIRTFANQAAVVIYMNELQRRRDEQAARKLRQLHDATRELIEVIDEENGSSEDEILRTLLENTIRLTGVVGEEAFLAALYLYDAAAEHFVLQPVHPVPEHHPLPVIYNAPLFHTVLASEEASLFAERQAWPEALPLPPRTQALIVTPLLAKQPVLRGVLLVCHDAVRGLDESDQTVIALLVRQAVLALEKAAHIRELNTRALLIWADIAQGILGHFTHGRVNTIRNYALIVQRILRSATTTEQLVSVQPYIEQVLDLCQEVNQETVRLTFPQAHADVLTARAVQLLAVERCRAAMHTHHASEVEIISLLEPATTTAAIAIGHDFLRHALDIIAANAVRAMIQHPTPGHKRLTITTTVVNGWLRLAIADTGPGIPSAILDQIFRREIKHADPTIGRGMGLLVARTIVEGYGGLVERPQTGPDGTTITIGFPVQSTTK
jgi:GAF domain-containing protein